MSKADLRGEILVRPLLCDGAMGTQLFAAGLKPGACGELWNVERPDAVQAIHQAYLDAGCNIVTTNSFGGTRTSLERHGLTDRVRELNLAAAKVAAAAAANSSWVLGDIGPFGGFVEPLGDTTPDELLAIFTEQAQALREGGADAALVETMSDITEACIAIKAARAVGSWPIIATFAYQHAAEGAFATMMGASVDEVVKRSIDAGADIVGANCGTSLALPDYARLAGRILAAAGKTPVIIQPNAGSPQQVDGKLHYPASPKQMADLTRTLIERGVRIVGGCCGTTPEHLRAMRQAIDLQHRRNVMVGPGHFD